MSVKRPCKISSDCFCYVCGYYISPRQKKHKVIPETKFFIAYETYFGIKMGDQDKTWAPHCKEVIQYILVFFVCGIIERMSSITWSKTGQLTKISHQAPTMF